MRPPGQGVAAVDTGMTDRFTCQTAGYKISPLATVLFGDGQSQQSHLPHFFPDIKTEFAFQVCFFTERCDLLPGEAIYGFSEHALFIGK